MRNNRWQQFWSKLFRRNSADKPTIRTPRQGGSWDEVLGPYFGSGSMSISAVYCCVNFMANLVASLPVQVMRKRGPIFVDDDSDLWYLLNVSPNEEENAYDFKKRIVIELLLEGNAYIVPKVDDFNPDWRLLTLCKRGSVAHDTVNDTYTWQGIVYSPEDIIHIKGYPDVYDPKRGVSVLTHARQTLDIADTADRETYERFRTGGSVRGIISNDRSVRGYGKYADDQLDNAAVGLDERLRRGERIVSAPGDVKFEQFSMSSADMQFLENRKFTVIEICRFFRVPPIFVYADSTGAYNSAEAANIAFLTNTFNPLLRSIEVEFLRKLISPKLARTRKIEFDRTGLHACDLATRSTWLRTRLELGIDTPNELRIQEGRMPVEGGDNILVSANLKTINQLLNESNNTSANGEEN